MKLNNDNAEEKRGSNFTVHGGRQDQAALRLQKVYKSFRARRQLADCAVVAEQKWSEELSKDEKARKLALQHWLEEAERDSFEVVIRNGKFVYKQSGQVVDTTGGPTDAKWIFVLSAFKNLYVRIKNKDAFSIRVFWRSNVVCQKTDSGRRCFEGDLASQRTISPDRREFPNDEAFSRKNSMLKGNAPEQEGSKHIEETNNENSIQANTDSEEHDSDATKNANKSMSILSRALCSKIRELEIAAKDDVVDICETEPVEEGGYETSEECLSEECLSEEDFLCTKTYSFGENAEGPEPYQLAQLLSCKWSSGVGARISCRGTILPSFRTRF
ncbi:hypothetical protein F3Y22_tig00006570pilonHSYRG00041 [Hibiscus syriacus]|uniref:Uncharacterized protein n=1 Tax=Hibiscus syriacus TaxID=106335 RepID=A0A6A3CBR8_HIBSY|nr:hypothetical protein F3Y22_tig00006570pilonHSYRG00041 [Hibiscus syriacus]